MGHNLRSLYQDSLKEPLPLNFAILIRRLEGEREDWPGGRFC
ncbi:NepR family anti-sigma factor [Microvirga brassicacearum]